MLLRLEIQNIALIEESKIDFGEGLNVLTGETGAGKSIIIDSINVLLGERFSKDLIRTGQEKALIEAVFQVDNARMAELYNKHGIEPENDGILVISREFSISGRNICRVNGRLVTVSAIKEIGGYLIDMHGQHDNLSLLKSETHVELLDAFGGERIQGLKKRYRELYEKRKHIINRLQELFGDEKDRERKIDLLKYQVDEIRKANLSVNEEEDLNRQKAFLANAGKIKEALSSVYATLFEGSRVKTSCFDDIGETIDSLNGISGYDERYKRIAGAIEDIYYRLEDAREEIRKERDSIEYNPYLLEQVEERLDLIFKLKRKYGDSIREILQYCKNSEEELERIIKSEEYIRELQDELQATNDSLYNAGKEISRAREEIAAVLDESIGKELDSLEMKKARFKAAISMEGADGAVHGIAPAGGNRGLEAGDSKGLVAGNSRGPAVVDSRGQEVVVSRGPEAGDSKGQETMGSRGAETMDSKGPAEGSQAKIPARFKFKPDGLDKVEFLISPNVGEPLKPLSRIASGGEMARILLAIKSILAGVDKVPVLIFDEIDIGISGKVARRVGEKLALLSKKHQVICVTHHPQIASMADNHYMVEKFIEGNTTKIKAVELFAEKITDEIARILGSESITDATRKLANEMLEDAKKFKSTSRASTSRAH